MQPTFIQFIRKFFECEPEKKGCINVKNNNVRRAYEL